MKGQQLLRSVCHATEILRYLGVVMVTYRGFFMATAALALLHSVYGA